MKLFEWNEDKNDWLKRERGISFEDVDSAAEEGRVLDIIDHPNKKKYPHQKVFVVRIGARAYAVPYVESEAVYFLKTMYPSRKYTRRYLRGST